MVPSTKCMCALRPLPPARCTATLPLTVRLIFRMLMVHAPVVSCAHAEPSSHVLRPMELAQASWKSGTWLHDRTPSGGYQHAQGASCMHVHARHE